MADDRPVDEHDDPALLPGTAAERADEEEHGLSAISPDELPHAPGRGQGALVAVPVRDDRGGPLRAHRRRGRPLLHRGRPADRALRRAAARARAGEVHHGGEPLHAPAQRQADLQAVLHHRWGRSRDPVHDRPRPPSTSGTELALGAATIGGSFPAWRAAPRRPAARRAARRGVRDRADPDRARGRCRPATPVGDPVPGHVLRARRVRDPARRPTGRCTTSPRATSTASTWCST